MQVLGYRRLIHTLMSSFSVKPVPVRDDNYAYLIVDNTAKIAAAVDPYDVPKVSQAAKELGVKIVSVLTTHHHFDHAGGNQVGVFF